MTKLRANARPALFVFGLVFAASLTSIGAARTTIGNRYQRDDTAGENSGLTVESPPPTDDGESGTASSADPDTGQAPSETSLIPPDVTVGQLGALDGPVVGLLDDSNGGLGAEMWSASNRADLENELARIPIVTSDPVVRELARRVLLTRAIAPTGPARHALIEIRLARLLDAGLLSEAGALAGAASVPNDPEFARVQAEALLYSMQPAVCSDKTNARLSEADTFWLELRAACYAVQGDIAAADLTKSVIDTQGASDAGFPLLLEDLERREGLSPGYFAHPTAVDVYILRRLGLPVAAPIASQLGTPADLVASRDQRNSASDRLAAAEQIVRTGALMGNDLRSIADAQLLSPDQTLASVAAARRLPFLERQILVRRAVALRSRPQDRLALIESADPSLNEDGPFHVFAALEEANIAATDPLPADGQASWVAARALILGGQPHAASVWLGAPDNPLTAEAALALDLAAPSPGTDAKAQAALSWFVAHPTEQAGGWASAAALAEGLWHAFSFPIASEPATTAAAPEPLPPAPAPANDGVQISSATMSAIDGAAADPNRRGEAVLRLIDAIGALGPARFAPDADIYFVSTLEKLNLDDAARQLAIECLLLGPPRPPHRPSVTASNLTGSSRAADPTVSP